MSHQVGSFSAVMWDECKRRLFRTTQPMWDVKVLLPLLLAVVPGLGASGAGSAELALELANELPFARSGELVVCGMPLARGFAPSAEGLTLLDASGQAVPAQIVTTSTYVDGTPRWLLLSFLADVPSSGRSMYRVVRGARAATAGRLAYDLRGGVARIDTGAAQFRIDTNSLRLFDSVVVGGSEILNDSSDGGATLELSGSKSAQGSRTERAEWEDAGSHSVVLAVRGTFSAGALPPLAKFVCRMHFALGSSAVRVFYTLRNPAAHQHSENTWDLGSGGSLFLEDFSLTLPLPASPWEARLGVAVDQPSLAATKLYQDSSGGPNWRSANHIDKDYQIPTRFRGYRVFQREQSISEGYRADGWIHVRGPRGGVAASVRDHWQNFPKALEWKEGRIRVGLWPGESAGVHELLGGEQKTHELLFVFHAPQATDESIERRMKAFQRPLYAMPVPEAVFATRAFWPTAPLDRVNFRLLEQTCDTFVEPVGGRRASVITRWDDVDEFGWRHFGDTFADNERSPAAMLQDAPEHHVNRQPISHFGNEYDVNYGVLLQGLRRHDPRWMWLADVMCRHYADICIYHSDVEPAAAYRHGPFTHTTHDTAAFRSTHRMYPGETHKYKLQYASGGPNAGHCYVASLAQHYYLTGDRNSREAFLEVAGWTVDSPWFTNMMMGDQRGIGNFLMTHVYAYQLTKDKKYYDAALKMAEQGCKPFAGLGGNLYAKAAGRFLDMKIENGELDDDFAKVRQWLLGFGDLYLTLPDDEPRRSLEQTCFTMEVLFTCYLHAPQGHPRREPYFARGKSLLDSAQDRWSGTYCPTKTLIMCFANTGAAFRALEMRRP